MMGPVENASELEAANRLEFYSLSPGVSSCATGVWTLFRPISVMFIMGSTQALPERVGTH